MGPVGTELDELPGPAWGADEADLGVPVLIVHARELLEKENTTIIHPSMLEEELEEERLHGQTPPPKKKKRWPRVLLNVLFVTVIVSSCLITVSAGYLNLTFNEPFFVNGMSMYPTLNKDGARYEDGAYRPLTWNDRSNIEGDIVDYGYAKTGTKGNWRGTLTRYDVVVCYYASDYASNELKLSADPKIKRLIAMPGETITFETVIREPNADGKGGKESVGGDPVVDVEAYCEDYNSAWGKTTITTVEGEEFVLKPLYDESDFPALSSGYTYPSAGIAAGVHRKTWTLGEGEYFVMGDNRGGTVYSKDSREVGPVSSEMIIAKAYLVTGRRKLEKNQDGVFQTRFDLTMHRMPWDYIHLDVH